MRKLLFLTLAVAAAGCAEPAENPPDAAAVAVTGEEGVHAAVALTEPQKQGRVIYETMCWTCHGPAGRADGPAVAAGSMTAPPTFYTTTYAEAQGSELQQRFGVSLDGTDPGHPHMQYVASLLKPESFSAALSYIPALVYPPEIPGSAINGERIYQFRCAACHGTSGKGDGPGAALLLNVKPADFTTDTLLASGDWNAVHTRIREGGRSVHGSSMPPWGIVLGDPDIWDLVAYLATFQPGLVEPPRWMN